MPTGTGGVAYTRKGAYDRAIQDHTEAIRLSPKDAEAYYSRGNAYREKALQDHDQAMQDYEQAVRLDPNDADTYYLRGNAYLHKGEYDRAIQAFTRAIRIDPDHADAYHNRGGRLQGQRRVRPGHSRLNGSDPA